MNGFRKGVSFVVFAIFFVAGVLGAVGASTLPASPRSYDDTVAYETTEELYQVLCEIPLADVKTITITNTSKDLPSNLSGEYIQARIEIETTNMAAEIPLAGKTAGIFVSFLIWLGATGVGALLSFGWIYPSQKQGGKE